MDKPRTVVLYGKSLVVTSLAASLADRPHLILHQLDASTPDLAGQITSHAPDVLIFDLATAHPDYPSQSLVSASLARLSATRVVVAHRLSTIVNADCIYALDEGQIVQSGTYAQLIQQRGRFNELAKRQLA